jgi:hypothetical protein
VSAPFSTGFRVDAAGGFPPAAGEPAGPSEVLAGEMHLTAIVSEQVHSGQVHE